MRWQTPGFAISQRQQVKPHVWQHFLTGPLSAKFNNHDELMLEMILLLLSISIYTVGATVSFKISPIGFKQAVSVSICVVFQAFLMPG
jgi:hypothetical protein